MHDPDPPDWAVLPAEEVLRTVVEQDSGGMLRLRRRSSVGPVVRISDRYLVGVLDLRAVELPYVLEFTRCRFEQKPDLRQAKLAGVEFDGCWLPGLRARNASSDNDIVLRRCTVSEGSVDLTDAQLHGSLVLSGSTLDNPTGRTLHADRLELSGALLAYNLVSDGEMRLPGMRAGGNVNLSGARLSNTDGAALDGNGLHVGGNLLCGKDRFTGEVFRSTGWLFLPSAHIASDLSLRGARLAPGGEGSPTHGPDDAYYGVRTTLIADRIRVDGNADLDDGFTSTGTLRMVNGRIGGSLRMSRAEIDISGGEEGPYPERALYLDGTEVAGDLEAARVRITGLARMADVHVRGSIRMDNARLANPDEDVWSARRLTVGSTFECRGADILGSVLMQGASIGANLDLRASRLARPGRYSRDGSIKPCLDIRAARIGRDLICASGQRDGRAFEAAGEIRMIRAEVGREINFADAELGVDGAGTALDAFGAQTQELVLTLARPATGRVGLRQVRCASLADNEKLWHAEGRVELDGFRYETLAEPVDLKDDARVVQRLRWLRRAMHGRYQPDPYDQLASVLMAAGNERHADAVLMDKQRHRYAALTKGLSALWLLVPLWSWLQRWMVGYGYRPGRLVGTVVVILVFMIVGDTFGLVRSLWFVLVAVLIGLGLLTTVAGAVTNRLVTRRYLLVRRLAGGFESASMAGRVVERTVDTMPSWPVEQVPGLRAIIGSEVRDAVQAALSGPTLVNFIGYLTVALVDVPTRSERRADGTLVLASGTDVGLTVLVQPDPGAREAGPRRGTNGDDFLVSEPVDIDGGRDADEVEFQTVIDSATLTARPRRHTLLVPHAGTTSAQVRMSILVPDSPGTHEAWIQLYQAGHLVQAVTVAIEVAIDVVTVPNAGQGHG